MPVKFLLVILVLHYTIQSMILDFWSGFYIVNHVDNLVECLLNN